MNAALCETQPRAHQDQELPRAHSVSGEDVTCIPGAPSWLFPLLLRSVSGGMVPASGSSVPENGCAGVLPQAEPQLGALRRGGDFLGWWHQAQTPLLERVRVCGMEPRRWLESSHTQSSDILLLYVYPSPNFWRPPDCLSPYSYAASLLSSRKTKARRLGEPRVSKGHRGSRCPSGSLDSGTPFCGTEQVQWPGSTMGQSCECTRGLSPAAP